MNASALEEDLRRILWERIKAKKLTGLGLAKQTGFEQAYIYKAGKYTNINIPGATQSFAHSINKNGAVVLTWTDLYGAYHGALLNGTSFYIFDDPNGTDLRADGINDSGLMVGRFLPSGSTFYQSFKGTL